MICLVFQGRPIIGIAGGIGSGKTFVARLFGELGCLVIHSDEQVRAAYQDPAVQKILRQWWGDQIFRADGTVDRSIIAAKIFDNPMERERLEHLLHPWVNTARQQVMRQGANDPQVLAFVWDTPLLFETGLNRQCDKVVFVETPDALRQSRLRESRGWDEAEWRRREFLQWPLDKKREMSDDTVVNTADAGYVRRQVREILSRTLTNC
jgi:dephospho-CoA kinase